MCIYIYIYDISKIGRVKYDYWKIITLKHIHCKILIPYKVITLDIT